MNSGIRKKMLVSFLGVALVSLLTIILLVNAAITVSFRTYLDKQRASEGKDLVEELVSSYTSGETWSPDTLMVISHRAMTRSLNIRIYDKNQKLIWSSTDTMGHPVSQDTRPSKVGGDAQEIITLPIVKDQKQIGTVELQPIDDLYHEHEQQFLTLVNNLMWIAMVLVLIGVYFFSRYIADGISAPLVRIKDAAVRLKEGDLSQRVNVNHNGDEVSEVGVALNRLAESLQEQEHLRKHLTADIAHELRTPLATIRSHIEAFQDGIWEPTSDKIQICHEQVMQLIRLIQDLEHLSDLENPMLKLNMERVDIACVVKDAANLIEGLWTDKEIILDFTEDRPVYVKGDSHRLLQVFVNLLNNAYKYTPTKGRIIVRVKDQPDQVCVEVSDTGIGIAREELPYIFERFFRGEKSRNRKTGGAGIGLAIVKAIVEAHRGVVLVKSEVNHGSQFTVCLPK